MISLKKIVSFFLGFGNSIRKEYGNGYHTGALPDKVDDRDKEFEVIAGSEILPSQFFLTDFASSVKNQGFENSCVPHAASLIYEMELRIKGDVFDCSEQQLYFEGRKKSLLFPQDNGMYPRDILKVMLNSGIAPETLCPYDSVSMNNSPGKLADSFKKWFKIKEFYNITEVQGAKKEISNYHPLIFNIPVYSSLYSSASEVGPKTGILQGYHEMAVIGYNDEKPNNDGSKGALLAQNSWGLKWGINGRIWIPYNWLDYSSEISKTTFYSIRV